MFAAATADGGPIRLTAVGNDGHEDFATTTTVAYEPYRLGGPATFNFVPEHSIDFPYHSNQPFDTTFNLAVTFQDQATHDILAVIEYTGRSSGFFGRQDSNISGVIQGVSLDARVVQWKPNQRISQEFLRPYLMP